MKTIIDAGHYYQVNGPSELSIKGWEIGKEISARQDAVELILFVDDYHQEQVFIEPGDRFFEADYAARIADTMFSEADYVFREATLAGTALQSIWGLLEDGLVKPKRGVVSAGGVRLGCLR